MGPSPGFCSISIYSNYQAYLPKLQLPVYLSISTISLETSFREYGLPFFFFFAIMCKVFNRMPST